MHFLVAATLVTLFSVFTCYAIVKRRRGDTVYWVVMAILLGPLAIPFAFFAKSKF